MEEKVKLFHEVGNFVIEKVLKDYTEEIAEQIAGVKSFDNIREAAEEEKKIPYIRIRDKNGMWSEEYIFGTSAFFFFESIEEEDGTISAETEEALSIIISQIFSVSNIIGDAEYFADLAKAFDSYMLRVEAQAKEVSDSK